VNWWLLVAGVIVMLVVGTVIAGLTATAREPSCLGSLLMLTLVCGGWFLFVVWVSGGWDAVF
jgi:hypothetical protein